MTPAIGIIGKTPNGIKKKRESALKPAIADAQPSASFTLPIDFCIPVVGSLSTSFHLSALTS